MSSPPPRSEIPSLADQPRVIDTPRLKIRPQVASDADAFFKYVSDPELTPFVTWAPHKSVDETREWIRGADDKLAKGTDVVWTIEHQGEPCGCVGLHDITWALRAVRCDRAELGYWIGRPLWRQGLMSEAAHAVTRWAFETLGLHKVTVGCYEGNAGSKKVIERIGFRFLCKREDDAWRDGKWHAHLRYELIAAEWADSTRTLKFNRPLPPP